VPIDSYGQLKLLAKQVVRRSTLDWVVLRRGAVVSVDPRALPMDSGTMFLEWSLPSTVGSPPSTYATWRRHSPPRRVPTSVVRCSRSGGDDIHRHVQADLGPAMVCASGLVNCYTAGRPGDPTDDSAWFFCDWMETERAQQTLSFQNHSWPQMLTEIRSKT
jgi:hypothetical protein